MFHGAHLRMRTRGNQPSSFHSFFGSVYTGNKQPFRRGVMFVFIAGVLILVGGILTWMGYSNVFGNSRISTIGPLLIALALLMFLIAIRQFLLAKKQTIDNRERLELAGGTVAAVVINTDERDDTVTVIMDAINNSPETVRPHGEIQPPSYLEATDTPVIPLAPSAPGYYSDPPPSYEEAITEERGSEIRDSVPVIK